MDLAQVFAGAMMIGALVMLAIPAIALFCGVAVLVWLAVTGEFQMDLQTHHAPQSFQETEDDAEDARLRELGRILKRRREQQLAQATVQ